MVYYVLGLWSYGFYLSGVVVRAKGQRDVVICAFSSNFDDNFLDLCFKANVTAGKLTLL